MVTLEKMFKRNFNESTESYFFSDKESGILKKSFYQNDEESLFCIGSKLYELKMYAESFRFLNRASKNKNVRGIFGINKIIL